MPVPIRDAYGVWRSCYIPLGAEFSGFEDGDDGPVMVLGIKTTDREDVNLVFKMDGFRQFVDGLFAALESYDTNPRVRLRKELHKLIKEANDELDNRSRAEEEGD